MILKSVKNIAIYYANVTEEKNMIKKFVLLSIFLMVIYPLLCLSSSAQTDANDYTPIFHFEAEETCFPINVSYHLDNKVDNCINQLLEETCFYDNIHGTINDDGVINHYKSVMGNHDGCENKDHVHY